MKYERLTKRYNGRILIQGYDKEYFVDQECPSHFRSGCSYAGKILYRLAELEDMIEDGQAKVFPCKVGDECFFLSFDDELNEPLIEEGIIESIVIERKYKSKEEIVFIRAKYKGGLYYWHDNTERLCFTKEEAEAKLKELKGE